MLLEVCVQVDHGKEVRVRDWIVQPKFKSYVFRRCRRQFVGDPEYALPTSTGEERGRK